jgi:guanylate kinase
MALPPTELVPASDAANGAAMTGNRRLFVVSAPSGAGKTTLVRALLERETKLTVCVSHTTRKPREHEINGRDYHFVPAERFRELIAQDGFIEHAQVFDNYYGTSRMALEQAFGDGFDVVLEIDWQGAAQVRARMPGCTSVFVLPPSRAALEQRLKARRTDSPDVIQRRLRDAVGDMSHYRDFDYVIVNDDFETALRDLQAICAHAGDGAAAAHTLGRLRPDRPELAPLLHELLG